MSNKPNFRKLKPTIPAASMAHLLATDAGQQIAQAVEELKTWCERVGLDFNDVTDLWQAYAKTVPDMSVVESIRHFKITLMERYKAMVGEPDYEKKIDGLKLILPGDKDFRQP